MDSPWIQNGAYPLGADSRRLPAKLAEVRSNLQPVDVLTFLTQLPNRIAIKESETAVSASKTRHGNLAELTVNWTDDPRWNAADRVAASRHFNKSIRLNAFLLHIVRCTIEERTDELTETQIGVQVFGRPPGYNPGEDNIVRSTARQLRQRLDLYYQDEGTAERTRIHVPRGGYVPVFVTEGVPAPEESATPEFVIETAVSTVSSADRVREELTPAPPAPVRPRSGPAWIGLAALIAGVILTVFLDRAGWLPGEHSTATDPLWAAIFSSGRKTLFVPGDAGLNTYNLYSGRPQQLSLREYINASHQPIPLENLASKQVYPARMWAYTPLGDVKLANLITRVGPFRNEHYEIHGGQEVTSDSFRDADAILSGAPPYNPWVELFDEKLNFHFQLNGVDNSMRVINRHPQSGESPTYVFREDPGSKLGYGYLALTDNLEGNGKALLIEGTSMAGVDAAVSFLFDEKKMAPIIARARTSQGKLSNFEVLLEAPFLQSEAANVSLVATRFYPND